MRSKLFIPGSRPELFAKAMSGNADALSIDLEKSVSENRKSDARAAVARFLRELGQTTHDKTVVVRVNGRHSGFQETDLAVIAGAGVGLIELPRTESAADVQAAAALLGALEKELGIANPIGLLASIESPRGLRLAAEIAQADARVCGLQIDFADLLDPMHMHRDSAIVQQIQLAVRLAAGEAGIWVLDSASADIDDGATYQREAEAARRMGFRGKNCIHPSQVPLANAVFSPDETQVMTALRLLEAAHGAREKGLDSFSFDGRLVNAAGIRHAEQVVQLAIRLGMLS